MCKKAMQLQAALSLLATLAATAAAIDNGLGKVPPMGWRSWNCFHGGVNQTRIEGQVDALVSKVRGTSLLEHGFASIGLDDNWQACGAGVNGSFHAADGTPLVNTKTFPNMTGMVAYGHTRGVRMGHYINNCICKEEGLTEAFADSVYHKTVDMLAEQGWDGVKIDSCSQYHRLSEWAELIAAKGKPLTIENCHDNTTFPYRDAAGEVQCPANFFRVSSDINAGWGTIVQNLQCSIPFNRLKDPIAGPGCFAYPDMLEVGNGQLTFEQSRSHFGAWIMVSSPLILGMDMSSKETMDTVWPILSNAEAINVSQTFVLHPGFLVASGNASAPAPITPAVAAPEPILGYVTAVPPDSKAAGQHGWSQTRGGSLRFGQGCLAKAPPVASARGVDLAFVGCANNRDQAWTFQSNGNLVLAGGMCLATRDWAGPGVVLFSCNTGVNEEWRLDPAQGTLCSGSSAAHPARCLAFGTKPPPGGHSGGRNAPPLAATWQVYAKPQPDNKYAVLLFNLANATQHVAVDVTSLGYSGGVTVRDIWGHTDWADGAAAGQTTITSTLTAYDSAGGAAAGQTTITSTLTAYDSALLMLSPASASDAVGAHPYQKISPEWAAKINATQYAAFTNASRCSYRRF